MKKEFNYLKYKKINKTWLEGYIDLYSKINNANTNKTNLETYLEVYSNSINKIIQINQNYIISNEEILTKYSNGDIPEKTQYTKYKKHFFDISIEKIDFIEYYIGTWQDMLKHECEVVTLLTSEIKKIENNSTKDEDLNLNKLYQIMDKCRNNYKNELYISLDYIKKITYKTIETNSIHKDTKEKIAEYVIDYLTEMLNESLAQEYDKNISNISHNALKTLFNLSDFFIENKIDVYPFRDNTFTLPNVIGKLDSKKHKFIAWRTIDKIINFSIKSSNNSLNNGITIFREMILDLNKNNKYGEILDSLEKFIEGYGAFKKYRGKDNKFDISKIENTEERYVAFEIVSTFKEIFDLTLETNRMTQEKKKIRSKIKEIIRI